MRIKNQNSVQSGYRGEGGLGTSDKIQSLGFFFIERFPKPGPLVQHLQATPKGQLVAELLQIVQILEGGVPVLHQDLAGVLAPHAVKVVLVSGLDKDPVEVGVRTGPGVVATLVTSPSRLGT